MLTAASRLLRQPALDDDAGRPGPAPGTNMRRLTHSSSLSLASAGPWLLSALLVVPVANLGGLFGGHRHVVGDQVVYHEHLHEGAHEHSEEVLRDALLDAGHVDPSEHLADADHVGSDHPGDHAEGEEHGEHESAPSRDGAESQVFSSQLLLAQAMQAPPLAALIAASAEEHAPATLVAERAAPRFLPTANRPPPRRS